jgi:hypothetical protein
MRSLWAGVAYIFNLISFSPSEDGRALEQLPLLGNDIPSNIPTVLKGKPHGPKFRPPSAPSWSDIQCDYSAMRGYSLCSTDGDRSCWLKDTNNETNHHYNLFTNYEKDWPIGTTRKVNKWHL